MLLDCTVPDTPLPSQEGIFKELNSPAPCPEGKGKFFLWSVSKIPLPRFIQKMLMVIRPDSDKLTGYTVWVFRKTERILIIRLPNAFD